MEEKGGGLQWKEVGGIYTNIWVGGWVLINGNGWNRWQFFLRICTVLPLKLGYTE